MLTSSAAISFPVVRETGNLTLFISAIPFKFKTLAELLNIRSSLFVNFPPPEIVSVEPSILTALPV